MFAVVHTNKYVEAQVANKENVEKSEELFTRISVRHD